MRSKWKLWLIPVVVILAFGVFRGGAIWGKEEVSRGDLHVQTVATAVAEKVTKENNLSLTGNVEAYQQAIISGKVAGRVEQILVENGAAVRVGQALVKLESQDYANALAMSQAVLKKAQTSLATTQNNFQRFQELHKQGAISQKDFEDIEMALRMSEADDASAIAAVSNAEEALRNATVSSPISGIVANKNVKTGQVLSPGVPLMTVEDISSVYLVVNIEQKDIAKVKKGLKAEVTIDGFGGQSFEGVVEIVNPVASPGARVFETKIKVQNTDLLLKPGMFAKVQVKTGDSQEVLAVQQSALSSKQGMFFIFVPEGDKVKRQQVEVGQLIGEMIEIKSGINEGQQVVVTNVNKLKDQDTVKIAQ